MSDGTIGTLLIIGSVFFDVFANICLKKSQGFKYKLYGFLAISLVGFAFLCLAYAISIMDLIIDKLFFGLRIKPLGIIGLMTMITGIILIKMI